VEGLTADTMTSSQRKEEAEMGMIPEKQIKSTCGVDKLEQSEIETTM